jgi:hypothetical protein
VVGRAFPAAVIDGAGAVAGSATHAGHTGAITANLAGAAAGAGALAACAGSAGALATDLAALAIVVGDARADIRRQAATVTTDTLGNAPDAILPRDALMICRAFPAACVESLCALDLRAAFAGNARVAATDLAGSATDARALTACRHDAVTLAANFAVAVAIVVVQAWADVGRQADSIAAPALRDARGVIGPHDALVARALPAPVVEEAGAVARVAADADVADSAAAD